MRLRLYPESPFPPSTWKTWSPTGTRTEYGPPPVGRLVAQHHAVWRITAVTLVDPASWTEDDERRWQIAGSPRPDVWQLAPYRVRADWVAGMMPDWVDLTADRVRPSSIQIPAGRLYAWEIYPDSDRWPVCSCCGEPMPCRAELQDREVAHWAAVAAHYNDRVPGACWACNQPITARQQVVDYPGDNLDLPGGHQPRFHRRGGCYGIARDYEERWLTAGPGRERILTWPTCDATLIVHAGGESECSDRDYGYGMHSAPGCQGHDTHDHGTATTCLGAYGDGGCPRGCRRQDHHGCGRLRPRPERRT